LLLVIHESIYNKTSNKSLLLEFKLREFGIIIDSISHRHGGTQPMIVKYGNGSVALTIPLDLTRYEDISTLKQQRLTQGYAPCNPSSFSDQVADKFYQQVIDTENYNASSTNIPDTSTVEFNQNNPKLFFYESSYLCGILYRYSSIC
jgi:hypothetical protein